MSSTALAKFLIQNDVVPTGDRKKDIELASKFFAKFKQHRKVKDEIQQPNRKQAPQE